MENKALVLGWQTRPPWKIKLFASAHITTLPWKKAQRTSGFKWSTSPLGTTLLVRGIKCVNIHLLWGCALSSKWHCYKNLSPFVFVFVDNLTIEQSLMNLPLLLWVQSDVHRYKQVKTALTSLPLLPGFLQGQRWPNSILFPRLSRTPQQKYSRTPFWTDVIGTPFIIVQTNRNSHIFTVRR